MTPERFETLAEAYGGNVARWPAAEREAAALLMAAQPSWAQAVLAQAGALDVALAAYAPLRASAALTDRIVASAPAPRRRASWIAWLAPAGLGAGLAAACAAGVMLGAQLAPPAHPPSPTAQAAAIADEESAMFADVDV
ncbi:MAG: hypothetical protein JF588_11920 [Caulobacterales bacterium]|nr:hypothetical protein [Caulobacterales bacterium]